MVEIHKIKLRKNNNFCNFEGRFFILFLPFKKYGQICNNFVVSSPSVEKICPRKTQKKMIINDI